MNNNYFYRRAHPDNNSFQSTNTNNSTGSMPSSFTRHFSSGANNRNSNNDNRFQSPITGSTAPDIMAPLCKHGDPAVLNTVRKEGPNKGRQFYGCSHFSSDNCGFFQWADALQLEQSHHYQQQRRPQGGGQFANNSCSTSGGRQYANTNHRGNDFSYEVVLQACSGPGEYCYVDKNNTIQHEKAKSSEKRDWFCCKIPHAVMNNYPFESNLKNIKDSVYDHKVQLWYFPLSEYQAVLDKLLVLKNQQQAPISIQEIPNNVFEILKHSTPINVNDDTGVDWGRLPKKLRTSLLEFQKQGVIFGVKKEGACLIGDEMGLGKTIQAIAIASYYSDQWPVLVICPSSLRFNWAQEFERWCVPDLIGPSDINVVLKGNDAVDCRVNIISYDLAGKSPEKLANKFNVIIADESHYLKSSSAKRTKSICPLLKAAKHKILLTGTPALARPIELYTQLNALMPNSFPRFSDFGMRYCDGKPGFYNNIDYRGASNLSELNLVLCRTIMIRRLKDDVLTQLPAKRRQQIMLTCKKKDLAEMKKAFKKLDDVEAQIEKVSDQRREQYRNEKRNFLMEMYKATGRAKIPAVLDYVKNLIESECKFLLFAHHLDVMDALEQGIKECQVDYIRIDGSTRPQTRHELATHFRQDPNCQVALLSITAAGTGLTLIPASNVVFAELHWTPGLLVQAEDRVHRIGQANSVNIKYLLAKDTLDDKIWPMIERKLNVVGAALNGQEGSMESTQIKWGRGQATLERFLFNPVFEDVELDDGAGNAINIDNIIDSQQGKQDGMGHGAAEFDTTEQGVVLREIGQAIKQHPSPACKVMKANYTNEDDAFEPAALNSIVSKRAQKQISRLANTRKSVGLAQDADDLEDDNAVFVGEDEDTHAAPLSNRAKRKQPAIASPSGQKRSRLARTHEGGDAEEATSSPGSNNNNNDNKGDKQTNPYNTALQQQKSPKNNNNDRNSNNNAASHQLQPVVPKRRVTSKEMFSLVYRPRTTDESMEEEMTPELEAVLRRLKERPPEDTDPTTTRNIIDDDNNGASSDANNNNNNNNEDEEKKKQQHSSSTTVRGGSYDEDLHSGLSQADPFLLGTQSMIAIETDPYTHPAQPAALRPTPPPPPQQQQQHQSQPIKLWQRQQPPSQAQTVLQRQFSPQRFTFNAANNNNNNDNNNAPVRRQVFTTLSQQQQQPSTSRPVSRQVMTGNFSLFAPQQQQQQQHSSPQRSLHQPTPAAALVAPPPPSPQRQQPTTKQQQQATETTTTTTTQPKPPQQATTGLLNTAPVFIPPPPRLRR